jgi:hypothetical protein
MAFSVTNTFSGSTSLAAADLDQNFTDITNMLNGNIDASNISSTAGIMSSQLTNKYYEAIINLRLNGVSLNEANTSNFYIGAIPYYSAIKSYTVCTVCHILTIGTGVPTQQMIGTLKYGNNTDGWTNIKASITTPAALVAPYNHEAFLGSLANTTITTNATRPTFLVFDVTQAGIGFNTGDAYCLSVLIRGELR